MRKNLYITGGILIASAFFAANAFAADGGGDFYHDFGRMLEALRSNIPAVVRLMIAASYVTGVWFFFSAIYELHQYGHSRVMSPGSVSFQGPLMRLLIGTFLLFLPGLISVATYTLWNYGASSVQEYYTEADSAWAPVFNSVIALVRLVGYVAIFRSLLLLAKTGKGHSAPPGVFGKGIIFMLGGTLCINIVGTIKMIQATFGLNY